MLKALRNLVLLGSLVLVVSGCSVMRGFGIPFTGDVDPLDVPAPGEVMAEEGARDTAAVIDVDVEDFPSLSTVPARPPEMPTAADAAALRQQAANPQARVADPLPLAGQMPGQVSGHALPPGQNRLMLSPPPPPAPVVEYYGQAQFGLSPSISDPSVLVNRSVAWPGYGYASSSFPFYSPTYSGYVQHPQEPSVLIDYYFLTVPSLMRSSPVLRGQPLSFSNRTSLQDLRDRGESPLISPPPATVSRPDLRSQVSLNIDPNILDLDTGSPLRGTLAGVLFYGHAVHTLKPQDRDVLKTVVDDFREQGGKIRIVGYASPQAPQNTPKARREANFLTSFRRVQDVAQFFINNGVKKSSLEYWPLGDTRTPSGLYGLDTEAASRRTEIYLVP